MDNALYESLFDLLPQAVVLVDGRLEVCLANQAAGRLFGFPAENLPGTPIATLVGHSDLPKLLLAFGEEPTKVIELHPQPDQSDGLSPILRITAVRFGAEPEAGAGQAGAPEEEYRLLVIEDFSERLLLEDQLVQAEKLAGMGQLAAGIAHELGNPLSSMSANLRYIRAGLTSNGHTGLVEPLEATLDHLEQMHHRLRGLSEFTNRRRPHYEPADVHALIRRSLAFISKEAERRGIEVVVSFADSLGVCHLDVRSFNQVLLNLFKNALEAMPGGDG